MIEGVEAGFAARRAELEQGRNEAEATARAEAETAAAGKGTAGEASSGAAKTQKTKAESPEAIAARSAKGKFEEIKKRMGSFSKLKAAAELWEQSMRHPMDIPVEGKTRKLGEDLVFVYQSAPSGEFKGPGLLALRLRLATQAEVETKDATGVAAVVARVTTDVAVSQPPSAAELN